MAFFGELLHVRQADLEALRESEDRLPIIEDAAAMGHDHPPPVEECQTRPDRSERNVRYGEDGDFTLRFTRYGGG